MCPYVRVCVCTYVRVYTHMSMSTYIRTYIPTYTYTHTYIHTYIHTYVRRHSHMCVYTHSYVRVYTNDFQVHPCQLCKALEVSARQTSPSGTRTHTSPRRTQRGARFWERGVVPGGSARDSSDVRTKCHKRTSGLVVWHA